MPKPDQSDILQEIRGEQRTALQLLNSVLETETAILRHLGRGTRATKIVLSLPIIHRKGKLMANFELPNDEVVSIPISTADAAGTIEPSPPNDTFSAVSSNPASLGASVSVVAGNPMLVLTPLVQVSPGITVTVSDSAGLAQAALVVDIVADTTDTTIVLNTAAATEVSQPVPTAPGP
jgi:hypothetical protein